MAKKSNSGSLIQRLFRRGDKGNSHAPIRELLEKRLMHMVYQPVVDLYSGEIYAYEALLRSESEHFLSPLDVLDAAVEAGCIGELGRVVRRMSVEGCTDFPLFLNLHPNELNEHFLVQPDDPIFWHESVVHVEITEGVPLSHFELCQSVLTEIRSKGINLAIDDLGAGYSNLKYIADLSPEIVKLDRALVSALTSSPRHQMLVKAIVELCDSMGAAVVAEGIETIEELRAVQAAGAQFGQGYLLARPAFPPPKVRWPIEDPEVSTTSSDGSSSDETETAGGEVAS